MTTTVERMKSYERREQLIQVAISLFARKGFTGTTTKEIAAAAGVTEALIFKYFPTKDALYEAILRSKVDECEIEEYLASLAEFADRRDDYGLFRAVIGSVIEFHRENPGFQRLMLYSGLEGHDLAQNFREQLVRPIHTYLEEYIRLRQAEGAFGDVDPAAAVFAVVAMPLHHLLVSNITNCPVVRLDDEQAVEQFTKIAVQGLLAR
jgi:AcrR family transcriptional regulator